MNNKRIPQKVPRFAKHSRFLSKIRVNLQTECWEWTATLNSEGYGMYFIENNVVRSAHRISYDIFKGLECMGLVIDHICRNRKCVNPDHLREVSNAINNLENSQGPSAINALKTHCKYGHEYTPENTRKVLNRKGHKNNRACQKCYNGKAIARLF